MTTKPTEPEVDLERGTANVERILHTTAESPVEERRAGTSTGSTDNLNSAGPTRKPRSDKGTQRPAKMPASPNGVLTEQQWARTCVLAEEVTQSAVNLFHARQRHERATAEFQDHMAAMKAK